MQKQGADAPLWLATRDAHELYEAYGGFQKLYLPEKWMSRVNQRLLRSSGQAFSKPGDVE